MKALYSFILCNEITLFQAQMSPDVGFDIPVHASRISNGFHRLIRLLLEISV